jgi:hypothetical protein
MRMLCGGCVDYEEGVRIELGMWWKNEWFLK